MELQTKKYYIAMYDKAVKERECKLWGIQNNFNYFFSVDIDEYMVVAKPGVSIVDSFENFISHFSSCASQIKSILFNFSFLSLVKLALLLRCLPTQFFNLFSYPGSYCADGTTQCSFSCRN